MDINDNINGICQVIINELPDDPIQGLAILSTCIDYYGTKLKFSHDELWEMVFTVKDNVLDELGEIE